MPARLYLLAALMAAALVASPGARAAGPGDAPPKAAAAEAGGEKELTPRQKFQKRFPQPVRVGDLIGLPVLDDDDSTIGFVREVVHSPDGKISLIVPYSAWFGWLPVEWGKRPVSVPIEVVALLARQLNSVDMARDDYNSAPTWTPSQAQKIPPDEKTLIALGRR
ncbi:MAG TPA: PRC-barrel domain-containing protein [Pseudolabrys sp.]|nr:PRC-barrel domain-containing protein [Pseudolabrys sp.]